MFRALLRLVLVVVVVVGAAAFFLGWWGGGHMRPGTRTADRPSATVGTTGRVDTEKARQVGAEVGEKTAVAASRAGEVLSDGALTAKIKSKMALDDQVQARGIDVSTTNHVVTLSGTVRSAAEHDRAIQLAKETSGVTQVIDRLAGGR
jgi:osmotically-inducible protein OsmY